LREDVLQRGQRCTKEYLDLGIKFDEKLYERIADNKKDVDEIQCPIDIAPNNMPTKFTGIHWTEVKKICLPEWITLTWWGGLLHQ
jgi:hypothetical protein